MRVDAGSLRNLLDIAERELAPRVSARLQLSRAFQQRGEFFLAIRALARPDLLSPNTVAATRPAWNDPGSTVSDNRPAIADRIVTRVRLQYSGEYAGPPLSV